MRVEVSFHGFVMRCSIFALLYHFREYTIPGMIVFVLWGLTLVVTTTSILYASDKYRQWKNRSRVKTGPMPYTGIYR